MAKQKLQAGLSLRAGDINIGLAGVPKEYTELYNEIKEVDNSNTPLEVFKFSETIAGDSIRNAKQLVLANEGSSGLEIQLKYDAWTNGTPDGNGSAVYTNLLLGCGEYIMLNDAGIVNFDENTSAANAYTKDNDSTGVDKGYSLVEASDGTDILTAEVMSAGETDLTLDSNNAYYFKAGDYIIINAENDVGTWPGTGGAEIIKVVSVDSSTVLTVERGQAGTIDREHADNSKLYWLYGNMNPNRGGVVDQITSGQYENIADVGSFDMLQDNSIAKVEDSDGDYISDTDGDLGDFSQYRTMNTLISGGSVETTFVTYRKQLYSGMDKAFIHIQNDIDAASAGTATQLVATMNTTNSWGAYRSCVFPGGFGRSNTLVGTGIVPGSVAIKFAVGGKAYFGLNGDSSTHSGLIAGHSYRFDLECDGRKETISFTAGKDLTLGGIYSNIADALVKLEPRWWLDTENHSPRFYWESRDLVIYSPSNMHTLGGVITTSSYPKSGVSTVKLSRGTSGSEFQLFGSGVFPRKPPKNHPSYFPDDKYLNPDTGDYDIDPRNFMLDDGNGNLYITEDSRIKLSTYHPECGWAFGPYGSNNGGQNVSSRAGGMRATSSRERSSGDHDHQGGDHSHSFVATDHVHRIPAPGNEYDPTANALFHNHGGGDMPNWNPYGGATDFRTTWPNGIQWDSGGQTATDGGHPHTGGSHRHREPYSGGITPARAAGSGTSSGTRNGKIYTGQVNYETGAIWIGWGPERAEMKFSCSYNSAFSGNIVTSASSSNGIQSIYARSTNQKTNGNLRIIALR
tara:strand:- start:4379 stop:6766 length:2388 start_codon:yes stop_codon:yes gene_type:complete